jgi:predicted metalloendopeptidase|tara:strand:+ start:320 stop:445 length:126 start_codon:yes stop_codon:yes gene_type:complete
MPISFKNFKKMIDSNKSMTPKTRKKALAKYKKRFKRVQKKL